MLLNKKLSKRAFMKYILQLTALTETRIQSQLQQPKQSVLKQAILNQDHKMAEYEKDQ